MVNLTNENLYSLMEKLLEISEIHDQNLRALARVAGKLEEQVAHLEAKIEHREADEVEEAEESNEIYIENGVRSRNNRRSRGYG